MVDIQEQNHHQHLINCYLVQSQILQKVNTIHS